MHFENPTARRTLPVACAAALAVAFAVSLAQPAHANQVKPPPVPANIQVDAEKNKAFFVGHAVGTQNYVCLPSGTGFKFALFTPQATLFDDDDKEVTTHYFSPNPFEGGTIRATWQHSRDTSTVWARCGRPIQIFQAILAIPPPTPLSSRRAPLPGSRSR